MPSFGEFLRQAHAYGKTLGRGLERDWAGGIGSSMSPYWQRVMRSVTHPVKLNPSRARRFVIERIGHRDPNVTRAAVVGFLRRQRAREIGQLFEKGMNRSLRGDLPQYARGITPGGIVPGEMLNRAIQANRNIAPMGEVINPVYHAPVTLWQARGDSSFAHAKKLKVDVYKYLRRAR